jgi:hypothetical protein
MLFACRYRNAVTVFDHLDFGNTSLPILFDSRGKLIERSMAVAFNLEQQCALKSKIS